jgi:hypothetical protein
MKTDGGLETNGGKRIRKNGKMTGKGGNSSLSQNSGYATGEFDIQKLFRTTPLKFNSALALQKCIT